MRTARAASASPISRPTAPACDLPKGARTSRLRSARSLRRFNVARFMPAIDDLPEGLTAVEFASQFGTKERCAVLEAARRDRPADSATAAVSPARHQKQRLARKASDASTNRRDRQ